MLVFRAEKQKLEDDNDTSSEHYHHVCSGLKGAEESIGSDWDGVTVLEDSHSEPTIVMPDYVFEAIKKGDIKSVLKWINANQTEDRANATSSAALCAPLLFIAAAHNQSAFMPPLLQLGADVDLRASYGSSVMGFILTPKLESGDVNEKVRLLLSWGASFFPDLSSREDCISQSRIRGEHELANLLESELGGRRCEIINLSSRPELNGKTCVADEYLRDTSQYKVTLETKRKEVLVLDQNNLKRRDRTPQDCGYYVEFKNGRTIRRDFDSSEDCQAYVAALNRDETEPAVTEEAEARADQAAAELLAELGLDDSPNETPNGCKTQKSKKKKGGKMKKKK